MTGSAPLTSPWLQQICVVVASVVAVGDPVRLQPVPCRPVTQTRCFLRVTAAVLSAGSGQQSTRRQDTRSAAQLDSFLFLYRPTAARQRQGHVTPQS